MTELIESTWQKEEFLKRVLQIDKHAKKEDHYNVMTKETYDKLLDEIEEAQLARKKTQKQYRRLNRFRVLNICGKRRLATKKEPMKYYLHVDEIYDIIETVHVAVGHGGRDRIKSETSKNYANVTVEIINIFLSMCGICQRKKSMKKRILAWTTKPTLQSEMNSRCQVDLIDMQTQEDHGFKFIMVYEDHLTKFVLLRALQSRSAAEVAHQLTDIFSIFGAPCILHSDNGQEFVKSVVDELTTIWPECKLVCGKPRQDQGSVEQAHKDIEKMLASWMEDNNTTSWSNGLRFVQFMKNRAHNFSIEQSPHKSMFGTEPRIGIMTSNLPVDIIKEIQDEDDLKDALSKFVVLDKENEAPNDVETLDDPNEVTAAASNSRQTQITATIKQEDEDDAATSNSMSLEHQMMPYNDDNPESVASANQETKITISRKNTCVGKPTKRIKLEPDLPRDPLEINDDMISVADIKVEFHSM